MSHRIATNAISFVILTLVYFAAGKLGLSLAFVHASATAVWAPTGVSLAAFLLLGYRVWPGIFLGALLVNLTTAGSVATSIGIATGNTLEGIAGAYLVNRFASGRRAFARSRDILKVTFLAAMLSTMISATIGVTSLTLGGFASIGDGLSIWITWWLGDAVGALIVSPPIILWVNHPRFEWNPRQTLEAGLLLLAVVFVGLVVFGGVLSSETQNFPLEFICLPLLVWAAFRFSPRESATAMLVLSGIAIWGTLRGFGPFVLESPNQSLVLLQAFMGVVAVTTLVLAALVSEQKRFETKLLHLVDHDPLTRLLNRRRFVADLGHQLAQARRYGTRGALMFVDLDDFKDVNDRMGHLVGDRLLSDISRLFRRRLRDSDLIGRLGGDEFAVLLPHADRLQALTVARQLKEAIASHVTWVDGQPVASTASIGIAFFPEDGATAERLLTHADAAMYGAKAAGRNRYCVYGVEENWTEKLENRFGDEQRDWEALGRNFLALHGQPILDLRRNLISQYELLVHTRNRKGDAAPLGTFLGIREPSLLGRAIQRWVVREAIHLLARHERRAPALSVNISSQGLADLPPLIRRELAATAVDPGRLTLEIAETDAIANPDKTREFANALKRMGCRFALDDFGFGLLSSFDHLEHLPVDYLKICGSLTRNFPQSPVDRHLVNSVVDLARTLRKETVAQLVSDQDAVHRLRKFGVDYAQGHHIGKPRAVSQIW
ncbi:MAG TPA: MASE1 domain-containing protein [Vicinamibacteria bacterium]|nr:MASE1 domain-containing protein [Vicinamibacteria bacterium]